MNEAEFGKAAKEICKYVEFVEHFVDFEMAKAEMERLIEDRKQIGICSDYDIYEKIT